MVIPRHRGERPPLLVAEHEDGGLISARTREAIERKIALTDERGGQR